MPNLNACHHLHCNYHCVNFYRHSSVLLQWPLNQLLFFHFVPLDSFPHSHLKRSFTFISHHSSVQKPSQNCDYTLKENSKILTQPTPDGLAPGILTANPTVLILILTTLDTLTFSLFLQYAFVLSQGLWACFSFCLKCSYPRYFNDSFLPYQVPALYILCKTFSDLPPCPLSSLYLFILLIFLYSSCH